MTTHISPPTKVPALIWRNTVLFALSQSFTGSGMQFAYGLGPLMVVALTHSASLSGLSVALLGLSRFLVAYPVGKITDTYGRKPGILLGLVLGLVGSIIVGVSMAWASIATLVAGLLVFGMGMNAAQQLRVAATDMFLPSMRAKALGYVAVGSMVGVVVSPFLIYAAEAIAHRLGQDPLGVPWLLMPALIVAGMVLVVFVRPDPKVIGMNLNRYYPDYVPPSTAASKDSDFSVTKLLRSMPVCLAIVANCAGQGNMSIVMVLTSLVLHHHGHSLSSIALSMSIHTMGMYAFSIPIGSLADRFGRGKVMFPSVAISLLGAALVAYTEGYALITLGAFLVGVGWSGANIAATALIADEVQTAERGRAIGVNDSFAGGISVVMAFAIGPLIEGYGVPAAGLLAVLVALAPFLMLAGVHAVRWSRSREISTSES